LISIGDYDIIHFAGIEGVDVIVAPSARTTLSFFITSPMLIGVCMGWTRGSQLKKIFVHPHIFNEKYPIRGIGKTKKYILNMKKI
jgi:hypothetical protein